MAKLTLIMDQVNEQSSLDRLAVSVSKSSKYFKMMADNATGPQTEEYWRKASEDHAQVVNILNALNQLVIAINGTEDEG